MDTSTTLTGNTSEAASTASPPRTWADFLRHVTPYLALGSLTLFAMGFMCIGFYVAANPGSVLPYLGAGWLAAIAAFGIGGLIGLVVGIPKFISSGALRHDMESGRLSAKPGPEVASQNSQKQASRFTPSSNLAEISDWLTKLLLGAGLVELTRLGRPLGALINTVAGGLVATTPPTGTAKLVAAGILFTYLALGFLDAYVVTTLWYGKHLQELGYQ